MVTVNICGIVNPNISFFYTVQNFRAWLDPIIRTTISYNPQVTANLRIFIGSLHDPFRFPVSWWRWIDIWWVDTPLYFENLNYERVLLRRRGAEAWVTSKYNAEMIRNYEKLMNEGKLRIIPRIAHPMYFIDYPDVPKQYDFIIVATSWKRKNVQLFKKVCRELGARCIEISPNSDIKPHTISERKKIELLLRSKYILFPSRSEGFGMPVLEANLLGVPAIYTDGHALREFAKGFPLPVKEIREDYEPAGRFRSFEVDEKETIEICKYCLELPKDLYQNLSEKIKEKVRRWQLEVIDWVNNYILQRCGK